MDLAAAGFRANLRLAGGDRYEFERVTSVRGVVTVHSPVDPPRGFTVWVSEVR